MLRRQPLRDTQELLVLFSPRGRIDCVSRISAKRMGLLEPLTCIRAHLRLGRSLPQLDEVSLDRTYAGLLTDYDRLHWAGYLLNLWLEAFPGEIENNDAYRLLRLSLDSLEAGLRAEWLVSWCELQAMRLLGSAPQLRRCVRCGAEQSLNWFSVAAGGALCSACRGTGARPLADGLRDWLAFLQRANLLRLAAARPGEEVVAQGRELIGAWILYAFPRLERFLKGRA
ncbi:MAG: DNA repair protein RecO [Candidatus Eremiobacteraeota bacterium]|nr:DNA repair protein RecO [Candidatus Eremiobacteraeota bacterium]MCW5868228.1 DNA repair protein RecO [Candidatus Eremiobacteraeota bacterium]